MRESKMLNSASQWFSSRSVNLMNTSQHTSCTSMTQSSDADLDSHQQPQRPRSPPLPESSDSALRERDETIASLEKARLVETQTLSEVRSNLDELRETFRSELYWRDLEISQLRREKASAQERLKTMEADLRNEDLVRDMANLIMEAAPNDDHESTSSSGSTADGEYVTELQSKLCKAMHKMAVMSEQMKMMQQSCDEVVNSLKDELSEYVDEKCKAEVELLNRIDNLEHDKKSIEEQLGAKLDVKQNRIEKLEKAIDDLREVTTKKNGESDGGGAIEAPLSTVDAVLAIGELKHQVERLSREKDRMEDTYEQDLDMQRKELRRLQKANKRKQRKLERLDLEHNLRRVDGMAFGGETKICFSAGYVSEDDDSDDEDDDGSDVQSQEEVALVALVNQIAAVTQNLEGELQSSIEKKEEVIASLENHQEDDEDKSIEPMEEDGEPPHHHTDISYARSSSSSHEQRRTST